MHRSLIPLLFIILILGSNAELQRVKLTRKKVHNHFRAPWLASTNVNIEKFPYLVNAEFGDGTAKPMSLVLYNPHIILSNCTGVFMPFNCDDYTPDQTCIPFINNRFHVDFPLFSLWGWDILLNMSMGGYGNGNRVRAHFANRCNAHNSFGTNQTYGTFGLAVDDFNYQNLQTDGNKFSLYLSDDGSDGQLIFGEDPAYEDSDNIIYFENVSRNWEMPIMALSLPMFNIPLAPDTKAIMDLSTSYIGVPDYMFARIINHLEKVYNVICKPDSFVKPKCIYTGNFDSLPSISLLSPNAERMLPISPSSYLTSLGGQDYQMEFASLTTDVFSFGAIVVNEQYENYIILGTPFLKYYYVVFDYNNTASPRLGFSQSFGPSPAPDDDTGSIVMGIILGVIILGVIGFLIYWAAKKNNERKAKERALIPADEIRGPTATYTTYNQ